MPGCKMNAGRHPHSMNPSSATCEARANIALVKYWGKRDDALNLPAAGSVSITLDGLVTRTTVRIDSDLAADRLVINGRESDPRRITAFLDFVRELAGCSPVAEVISENNFPTGAGLASSASGFAALAGAASAAMGLQLDNTALSVLARRGSGSAARSIHGGFVRMHAGTAPDGSDACAEALHDADHWPLQVVIAITDSQPKAVDSRDGMNRTRATSPYYPAWLAGVDADIEQAVAAIAERDFGALAAVSEHSALKMHASALAARPGLWYLHPATVACMNRIVELRADGVPVFFTMDAGPQVKAVCEPGHADQVAAALAGVDGVQRVLLCGLGAGLAMYS